MVKKFVIIVAGGTGQRFGAQIPKQFVLLKGFPILMHSIKAFYNYDPAIEIIITLPSNYTELWQKLCHEHHFQVIHKVVEGGINRFYSVKNGLDCINENGIVAIHDAVRPLVSKKTIDECFNTAMELGNAIPVVPMIDSIRQLKGRNNFQANRDAFVSVQTPQVFKTDIIKDSYTQEYNPVFTDDASVLEKAGYKIVLTGGNRENIKITNGIDLLIAEALFESVNC